MAVDFRPELMLKSIVYCALADCPRSTFCLRYLAYKASDPFWTHAFVDPCIQPTEQGCSQYLSSEVQRMGRGFRASMQLVRYGSISTPFVGALRTSWVTDAVIPIATLLENIH